MVLAAYVITKIMVQGATFYSFHFSADYYYLYSVRDIEYYFLTLCYTITSRFFALCCLYVIV